LVSDAVSKINWKAVSEKMIAAINNELINQISAEKIAKAAIDDLLSGNSDILKAISKLPIDFSAVGDKLKEKLPKILKLDPTNIQIKTSTVELVASLKFLHDDPVYGDCFKANVDAKILLPKQFSAHAILMIGKKDEFKYWFVEVGVSEISVPLTPIPLVITGVNGRLFHFMKFNGDNQYIPDKATKYGAALQLFFVDAATSGKTLKFDVLGEFTLLEGGFNIEIRGSIFIANDESGKAKIDGKGFLKYSSITGELLGKFNVKTNTDPVYCAQGELGIHIRDGAWNVYIGKRDNPFTLKPICPVPMTYEAWLDVNQDRLDIGFRLIAAIKGETPWLGPVRFYANIGLFLEISAIINWSPFGVKEALVELKVNCNIGCEYNFKFKSGSIDFVDIYLHGLLKYSSIPQQYVEGRIDGYLHVLGVGYDFNLGGRHNF